MAISSIETSILTTIPSNANSNINSSEKIFNQLLLKHLWANMSPNGEPSSIGGRDFEIWKGFFIDYFAEQMTTDHTRIFGSQLSGLITMKED